MNMNLTVSFFIDGHIRETRQISTPCTIGRNIQSGWVLMHPTLSRHHCILFDKEGEIYLCDDGSLNGTRFRGSLATQPVRLQFGDEFTVGKDLTFRISAPIDQAPTTERLEFTGQTTIIFTQEELESHQSTLLSQNPAFLD